MTKSKFARLFERTYINKLGVSNRLCMAPMGSGAGPAGAIVTDGLDYYEARAKGGTGMLMVGYQLVTNKTDPAINNYIYAGTTLQDYGWARLVERSHAYGTAVCLQMTCGLGPNARPVAGQKNVAASDDIPCHYGGTTRALTIEEIHNIVKCYSRAAEHAINCGVDAIEIHGHLGYLLDTFMTPLWNKRTDEYGGSFENRMRFTTEIYHAIREKAGPDFPIMIRLVLDDMIPGGRTMEESLEIIRYLDGLGMDAFDVDLGCYQAYDWAFPTAYMGDACMAYIGDFVRKVTDKPIMTAGNYTPESALKAVEDGLTDFVLVGRGLLADPDWGVKLASDRPEDIRPCLRCNEYCLTKPQERPQSCAVNPQCLFEKEYALKPAPVSRKVVVIGGGPAGMEAARVAATIGHDVTLYEKGAALGGQLIPAATPQFKGQIQALNEYLKVQLDKLGVKVVCNMEITADSPVLADAHRIIVATGATGFVPPIPGKDRGNVLEVIDAHIGEQSRIGQKVVVAGGGFSGCDCAIDLAMEGKDVTIVEMLDRVVPKASLAPMTTIARMFKEHNIKVYTSTRVLEFNDAGVRVAAPEGELQLECDTVIAAFGTRPNAKAAKEICDKYWNAVQIGDCVTVGQIGEAVRAGFFAGRAIL